MMASDWLNYLIMEFDARIAFLVSQSASEVIYVKYQSFDK